MPLSVAAGRLAQRSTTHSTFVIERTSDATPARVFDAWADPVAKAQWFGPSDKPDYSPPAEREHGTEALMDALGEYIQRR
jgi:uncharacterized protein YndB with AHSA1/START domain